MSGFTPSVSNRIAQPTGTSYTDTGLAAGTYFYKVTSEDAAGNVSVPSTQATATVSAGTKTGLVASYGFDEGTGTTTADRSGNANTGTLSNATWASGGGKFGNALFFNGTSARVNVSDSASLHLASGMTMEAWVKPSLISSAFQTVVLKEQTNDLAYALYANTRTFHPDSEAYIGTGSAKVVDGTSTLPTGTWSHVAATYDGSALRLYVNGSQVSQVAASGSILSSTGALRIGGNNVWGEWFNGWIDEVRVYNRALSTAEIQDDMNISITPDTIAPTLTAKTPASGSAGINVGSPVTATFSELMRASTLNSSTFVLKDASNNVVPASISYNPSTNVGTLTPLVALQYGANYTATIKGGTGGVTDYVGNALAADISWSFTTEASPPQILVVNSTGNPFTTYLTEILRNEGVNAFTTLDASLIAPAALTNFDVVVLGNVSLTAGQVATLSSWVNGGGNLVAMRPDKQLAGLLGLSDAGATLSNAYLKVDTATAPGAGIVGQTIQFHGSADLYTLNGATEHRHPLLERQHCDRQPGGDAALGWLERRPGGGVHLRPRPLGRATPARATRPGPARSATASLGIRPDDMFYGAKAGDVQPDWIDTSKIAIPQADEQQRLLVNLITLMERDKLPLPHFWYLPRGQQGGGRDERRRPLAGTTGGTASHFDRFKALSTAGCVVANWECVRATSYIFPTARSRTRRPPAYIGRGLRGGAAPDRLRRLQRDAESPGRAARDVRHPARAVHARSTRACPSPVSSRTHCVDWPDWASEAKVELAHGIRMDGNYYHFPAAWIGTKPGFLNGGGFPMRFADIDGSLIDVYQENTNMDDEAGQVYPATVDALLDNALGAHGYYGAFGTNIHTDSPAPKPDDEAIVASAQARGVPVISYKQMLDWTDGRNNSTIRALTWSAGSRSLTFTTTVAAGANGLQTMLPTHGPTGTLTAPHLRRHPASYTLQTDQGHRVRDVPDEHRLVYRIVFLEANDLDARIGSKLDPSSTFSAWRQRARATRIVPMGLVEAVDHGRRRRVAAARVALALAAGLVALSLVSDSAPAGSGLVAAYAFNEGAGAVATDASGNDHPGAIQGAAWTTGHTGTALSFDGTTSNVAIGSLGTFYKSGFTLEAWVRKRDDEDRRRHRRQLDPFGERRADALGQLVDRPLRAHPGHVFHLPRLGSAAGRRPVAVRRRHLRRHDWRASTSTARSPPRAPSPATSATRTRGASVPTTTRPPGLFDGDDR